MVQQLAGHWSQPRVELPGELELRPWRDDDLVTAARLIAVAYNGHPDSLINDQYRSVHGSMRFLHNHCALLGLRRIFPTGVACGGGAATAANWPHWCWARASAPQSGHITQLCVHPSYRRHGVARLLLSVAAAHFVRQGVSEISLTVTEANVNAIKLYENEGYTNARTFSTRRCGSRVAQR